MKTISMRIVIAVVIVSSVFACRPELPDLPTNSPTGPAPTSATAGLTLPAATTTEASQPGLTSSPEQRTPDSATDLLIVYLKDGDLWSWREGMNNQLTQDGRVSSLKLSGDRNMVAFTRLNEGLENELWAINQDGTDERLLIGPEDLASLADLPETEPTGSKTLEVVIFNYEWLSGQHTLAYDTRRHLEEPGTIWHDDLRLVDAETGERMTLLAAGRGGRFTYSPDGLQVAIVTPNNLSIMNADGSLWRKDLLEYPSVMTYSEYQYYPRPTWSADSTYLLLALPPKDPLALETPPQPTTLWRIPSDGTPPTRLGNINPAHIFAFSVAFSPDLSRLAYLTEAGEPVENRRKLHIANIDGTGDRVVQEGLKIRFESWSPDGRRFVFSFGDPEAWTIGGIDGDSTPLAFHLEDPLWVDNDSFLHVEDLGSELELRLTRLNGESLVIDRMRQPPVSFDFGDNLVK